jgi:hypothetical protein
MAWLCEAPLNAEVYPSEPTVCFAIDNDCHSAISLTSLSPKLKASGYTGYSQP